MLFSMTDFILNNQVAFYYAMIGLAFFGLTFRPVFAKKLYYNVPVIYIAVGALAAVIGLPIIDPMNSELESQVVVHASKLVVIISLVGAGLAIDLKPSLKNWDTTWRLLAVTMPLTIIAITYLGLTVTGLSLAGAILLGAALAPTDPVLARSVHVGPPHSDQEGKRMALTAEAGLNDGLAFPFIWLAIGLAVSSQGGFNWVEWSLYDGVYKVIVGIGVGMLSGWLMTKLLYSRVGDATNAQANPILTVLAITFIAYGFAELIHGYGFLSVFVAARAGRAFTKGTEAEAYETQAHKSADQLEAVLLAIILLWFGAFVAGEVWQHWTAADLGIALAIIFVIRPVAGLLALMGQKGNKKARMKIAFFGIRGMGSIFYAAFALHYGEFDSPERIWSILSLTILISALIHGSLANRWMESAE